MFMRLPLSVVLLALAALNIASGAERLALPIVGAVVGVLLALTALLDALWLDRSVEPSILRSGS